jgi:hypothetical protein
VEKKRLHCELIAEMEEVRRKCVELDEMVQNKEMECREIRDERDREVHLSDLLLIENLNTATKRQGLETEISGLREKLVITALDAQNLLEKTVVEADLKVFNSGRN